MMLGGNGNGNAGARRPRTTGIRRVRAAAATAALLVPLVLVGQGVASATDPGGAVPPAATASAGSAGVQAPADGSGVPQPADDLSPDVPRSDRADVLGDEWSQSRDRAWELSGDAAGLHVLVADADEGYALRTLVTLVEPEADTDRWIGHACVTSSGRRLVVAYAPRGFTNDETLFLRGAYTAVVDLTTGDVVRVPVRSSLEYFSPSCGHGEQAVLTVSGGEELAATRLVTLDAETGQVANPVEAPGQLTSAVLTDEGLVAASAGAVVHVAKSGKVERLATANAVPYELHEDVDGGLVFLDHDADTAHVRRLSPQRLRAAEASRPAPEVARGALTDVGVTSTAAGRVLVTGPAKAVGTLPAAVRLVGGTKRDRASLRGEVTLSLEAQALAAPDATDEAAPSSRVELEVRSLRTGRSARIGADVTPHVADDDAASSSRTATRGSGASATRSSNAASRSQARTEVASTVARTDVAQVATTAALAAAEPDRSHEVVEGERTCSVPRNDPANQAMQPKPRQVEWAVDQAVQGSLVVNRPANWKNLGMPAYDVQTLFPTIPLDGGGAVPAQVMLGILAQESNLWQAPGYVTPGVTGSPLIGNYYGVDAGSKNVAERWAIDWTESDCGYGVAQVTDGMASAATGVTRSYAAQRAIALDFVANVAAGLQILELKWNQTRAAGLTINDGDPSRIENWYFAIWAYNTGLHPKSEASLPKQNGAWGVGWLNNPANPSYRAGRGMFGKDPMDLTKPEEWTYPEKVIGFAAYPPSLLESPGTYVPAYRAAWWPGTSTSAPANRDAAIPPILQFCTYEIDCDPSAKHWNGTTDWGPCAHTAVNGTYDGKCWFHEPAVWKYDCQSQCGRPFIRFVAGYAYQEDGTAYPPDCGRDGLPSGAIIVDDVPDTSPIVRPGCAHGSYNATEGSFTLTFASDGTGHYPSKIDFHQLGAGFNGHFWFGHTRTAAVRGGSMKVTGTWSLGRRLDAWTRVMVHLPDLGAHTREATYLVDVGDGSPVKRRVVPQRWGVNTWVSLGVFDVHGVPKVTLSTETPDGDTGVANETPRNDDVAFDAVAFEPLPAKPATFMVALGDSYSSGEGGKDSLFGYDPVSDNNGHDEARRDACHRSEVTWSRVASLPDSPTQVRTRVADHDPTLDYHLIACSGAQTYNLLPTGLTLGSGVSLPTDARGRTGAGQYGELAQLDQGYVDENTTLVTLSIGGNDGGFSDIVQSCIGSLSCMDKDDGGLPQSLTVPRRIKEVVQPSIKATLRQIHKLAPRADVMLMGYPHVITAMGCGQAGLAQEEIDWLGSLADDLAREMGRAVIEANGEEDTWAYFMDPRDAFAGRGACGFQPLIHSIVTDTTPGDSLPLSLQSFHPNVEGYRAYAGVLTRALAENAS